MRLYVYLLEGKGLEVKDSYVKLKVGRTQSKTRVVMNTKNPVWNEEFVFRVRDLEDELVLSVYQFNEDSGFFNVSKELVGRVRIPLWFVTSEESQNLPPTWFNLEKRKSSRSVPKDVGKILLSLSLHGKTQESTDQLLLAHPNTGVNSPDEHQDKTVSSQQVNLHTTAKSKNKLEGKQLMKTIAGRLEKLFNKNEESSKDEDSSEVSAMISDNGDFMEEQIGSSSFEELIETMQSSGEERETPENLPGGILLDQTYVIKSEDLNMLLFAPDSQLMKELRELQGTTDVQESPWKWKSEDKSCITRVVTYTKAATKLIKAVKATEEQTYIKANGKEFDVLFEVITPDVPYGSTFKVNLLYKITPGQKLSSEEETANLTVSWAINFHQSTMMRGMIEGGTRQGLKESFDHVSEFLAQHLKVIEPENMLDKDHMLAALQEKQQSTWKLGVAYLLNWTVISTIFMALYVFLHIIICGERKPEGLEFQGLDLPESVGELITSAILVFQLQQVFKMVSHFIEAKLSKGSDHGVKAQGDGWVLTVALVEGMNIASLDSTSRSDPYVVFTCNGKTKTSSVKLQTLDPLWNEILEFDASDEPPSVLDVEVFDFDGPFDQDFSLGHAEINFLKHTSTELADMWVPLEGKLAQACQSKLHLRIFLDNNNGVETIREYLSKMEKEVGKKLTIRSPHRNSSFQKTFGLPPEEFLISDFSCSLKRKMPLQGRIFLSARIVGFYANLFGHKTKFFFLWEDIEDIQILPPSLGTVGSPLLVVILHKGRGTDARHGAKSQDEEGRLHFYFHSFVSFNVASRTIMALWRTRTLAPDERAEIAEEQQETDDKSGLVADSGFCSVFDETKLSNVLTFELPIKIESLMQMFKGGNLEQKVMSKSGCLSYATTPWKPIDTDIIERHTSYKFHRSVSVFGGEVTCTQRKSPLSTNKGWILREIMTLHNVPFGNHFRVLVKYEIENASHSYGACRCSVFVGVAWLRSTMFEQRITRNILKMYTNWIKEILQLVEREILFASS